MAERRTLICDVCGTEQVWDNHNTWFGASLRDIGPPDVAGLYQRKLELFPLTADPERANQHLCGASCVTLKVSEFLGQKAAVQ